MLEYSRYFETIPSLWEKLQEDEKEQLQLEEIFDGQDIERIRNDVIRLKKPF